MPTPSENRFSLDRLTQRQHGVVAARQLRATGVGRGQIEHWIRVGLLLRVFRATFVMGRMIDRYPALWMAAVLRGGEGAALAGRSAAAAWQMMKPGSGVLVMRPDGRTFRERGIDLHQRMHLEVRSGSLAEADLTWVGPVRVMTPARVLIGLAGDLGKWELRRIFVNAGRSGLLTPDCLEQCTARSVSFKGRAHLMALVEQWLPNTGKLRSPLESDFLLLCGRYGIPAPRTNFRIGGYEVDCFWPGTMFVVELDSRTFHDDGFGFEDDRKKGNALAGQGYMVLRFTHRMIKDSPAEVARILREHLGR